MTSDLDRKLVGWILLALSVALVNAGSGLTALWILLVCFGWVLVVMFPGRWACKWLAIWTGSGMFHPCLFFQK